MAVSGGVLVLRALGIGDLLTAVPALRGLRRHLPDERLVLAAPGELADLVELIDAVDELLPTPGLGTLSWPGEPPRLAVNLHGRGRRASATCSTSAPSNVPDATTAGRAFPSPDGATATVVPGRARPGTAVAGGQSDAADHARDSLTLPPVCSTEPA
ncbi:hypothetical protein LY13_002896 [Prauserella aidingensis]|uniref:hypothetical protein n=1 Tax=Prauserella aidingensis TaxID=387890 RepID=UPI00355732A9|nr:hypothetical protein [Prauserella aidingensis]